MAAITICSDFGAPPKMSDTVSPSISHEVMGPDTMIFIFWLGRVEMRNYDGFVLNEDLTNINIVRTQSSAGNMCIPEC